MITIADVATDLLTTTPDLDVARTLDWLWLNFPDTSIDGLVDVPSYLFTQAAFELLADATVGRLPRPSLVIGALHLLAREAA